MIFTKKENRLKKSKAMGIKNNHRHLEKLNCLNHRNICNPPFLIKLYLRWSVSPSVLYMRTGSFPSGSSKFLMVSVLMECKQAVTGYSDIRESPGLNTPKSHTEVIEP